MVNIINLFSVAQPTGFWEKIIIGLNNSIANYALVIILVTLIIKAILTPLDFFNKKFTRKNARVQQAIKPELDVLKKKYGNDSRLMNQKTMELYKKHNYSMGGSCIFMLANLVITMVILFSLLGALNNMAEYKITSQYEQLQTAYYNELEATEIDTDEEKTEANQRVLNKYNEIKDSWLWIENVWISDSPFADAIPTFDNYSRLARLSKEEANSESFKTEYNKIMNPLRESYNKKNGYYIILLLIIGASVLQQITMYKRIRFKKKSVLDNEFQIKQPANKSMAYILPIMLGIFALIYNSVFALYILVGALWGVITTPFINSILFHMEKKEAERKKKKNAVSYSRK